MAVATVVVIAVVFRPDGGAEVPSREAQHTAAPSLRTTPPVGQAAAPFELAVAAPSANAREQIEICGVGWVQLKADGTVDDAMLRSAPELFAARRRILDAMRVEPDEFSQAAASWLDYFVDASEQKTLAALEQAPCKETDCAVLEEERQQFAGRRNALAVRALATADPRVYALAFRACANAAEQGTCAMLSAARWAQVDPGNAMPWLFLLDEASKRHDEAAVADALFHIASSRRFDDRTFSTTGLIVDNAGSSDVELAAAFMFGVETIGIAAAQSLPLQTLTRACRPPAIGDANRRQVCDGVVEALVERSDSLLLTQIGVGMGRRLDWPEERTDSMSGKINAWLSAEFSEGPESVSTSCKGMRKVMGRMSRQARIGEVGAMHEWAVKSGRSRESFAQAGRDTRVRSETAQAAAAREAAAPSATVVAGASAPR